MPHDSDEQFWQQLIDKIDMGTVVPIVGPDAVVIAPDGKRFKDLVAERVAKRLSGVTPLYVGPCKICGHSHDSAPPEADGVPDLNDLLCGAGRSGNRMAPNPDAFGAQYVQPIVEKLESDIIAEGKLPPSLVKLAEIPKFDRFVTTTYDGLLGEALRTLVADVKESVPGPAEDDAPALAASNPDVAQLLFLFGRAQRRKAFAFAEAQYLHQIHELIARSEEKYSTTSLWFGDKDLLFIGVTFPDWLARFLIKTARGHDPLWERPYRLGSHVPEEFIVNSTPPPHGLETFLDLFMNKRTYSLKQPMTCAEFIDELHQRWFAEHPETRPPKREKPAPVPAKKRPTVFISYSHEGGDSGHMARVKDFVLDLRKRGDIDIILDVEQEAKFPAGPPKGWDIWSTQQCKHCDRLLVIGSKTYYQVWEMEIVSAGGGKGAATEAAYIRDEVYHDFQKMERTRTVMLQKADEEGMPLGPFSRGRLALYRSDRDEVLDRIYKWITQDGSLD